jgi:hypothetical protein
MRYAAIIGSATRLLLLVLLPRTRLLLLVLLPRRSAGRHIDLEDVRTTADQQGGIQISRMCGYAAIIGAATTADQRGGIQILRMCGYAAIIGAAQAQRSYYWCGSDAATQLLSALLRSSYRRCYAALIGAATQLLSALLRSSTSAATQLHQRCYAAPSALLRSSYRRCYAALIGAATTGGSAGVAVKRGRGAA